MQEMSEEPWNKHEIAQNGVAQGVVQGIAEGINQGIEYGLKLGRAEGRVEGQLEILRSVLLKIVERRFPEIGFLAQRSADAIQNPQVLEAVLDKIIEARNGGDAFRVLQVAQQPLHKKS